MNTRPGPNITLNKCWCWSMSAGRVNGEISDYTFATWNTFFYTFVLFFHLPFTQMIIENVAIYNIRMLSITMSILDKIQTFLIILYNSNNTFNWLHSYMAVFSLRVLSSSFVYLCISSVTTDSIDQIVPKCLHSWVSKVIIKTKVAHIWLIVPEGVSIIHSTCLLLQNLFFFYESISSLTPTINSYMTLEAVFASTI